MKDLFKGYYRPNNADFKEIWESAFFVFDTNILLNLYRWPSSVNEDFWKVIDRLASRVWLPHQVALEFQRKRLIVINEQQNKYNKVIDIFNRGFNTIEKEINDMRLNKTHSEIKPEENLNKIKNIIHNYSDNLKAEKDKFCKQYSNDRDDILKKIENIFANKIGEPFSQQQLDNIYKIGQEAYSNRRPPGYKDKDKPDSEDYFFSGNKIVAKYGDAIIWQQILSMVKAQSNDTSIVLVTDDAKEDWWRFGTDGKALGPRPELVEDILNTHHGKNFYMYNSERFLKYANEYLKLNVKDQSIQFAKENQEAESEQRESVSELARLSFAQQLRRFKRTGYDRVEAQKASLNNFFIGKLQIEISSLITIENPITESNILAMQQNLKIYLKNKLPEAYNTLGHDIFNKAVEDIIVMKYINQSKPMPPDIISGHFV